MSGIYFHIPFCKQACHYCDFHFSTNRSRQGEMVQAIAQELSLRKAFLQEAVKTIYFGGGTPSLLQQGELALLLAEVRRYFKVAADAEITLEANPDDLTEKKLQELKKAGINRLSIGIQSFHGPHLDYMNRAHNESEALVCVQKAQQVGFRAISIDLIYGIPAPDHGIWESDLSQALRLKVPHISAYCLTIEPRTAFGNWLQKGKIQDVDDAFAAKQFEMLVQALTEAGYEHYEVSNFALPGHYSRHNTAYWQRKPYLGIGPGAHSFNGAKRVRNLPNNAKYLKALGQKQLLVEEEHLSHADRVNEWLMTSLRTQWGCDLASIKKALGYDLLKAQPKLIENGIRNGNLQLADGKLKLTPKGLLFADAIAADFFVE